MSEPLVSIITPTYNQSRMDLFYRMFRTVQTQTYRNWEHIVCSDGPEESNVKTIIAQLGDVRRTYCATGQHFGGYGAAVRQFVMDWHAKGKYYVFLDDDNILMPDYLEKMVGALESSTQGEKFAICKILHFGPLRQDVGVAPMYLRGEPKLCFIDTLQIIIEAEAMKQVGWVNKEHYCADGYTYEELGRRFKYARIDECLAIHM